MKRRLLAKKISLIVIIFLFISSVAFAYFLDSAQEYNTYMERFENVIKKLGHNEYSVPYRAISGDSHEPALTNNIQDILRELEEIVNNTIY